MNSGSLPLGWEDKYDHKIPKQRRIIQKQEICTILPCSLMESLHPVPVSIPPKEHWQRKEDSYKNDPGSHRDGVEKFSQLNLLK